MTAEVQKQLIRGEADIAGKKIQLESGIIALLSQGACTVTMGGTVVLVTANMSPEPRNDADFFPLTVEYQERLYAVGKIKGSRFIKRETRPSDNAILISRLIDRPIRPLFPKGILNEVQIVATVLSADMEHDPATCALIGTSFALLLSGIPFEGPMAGVKVGLIKNSEGVDTLIVNPTYAQIDKGSMELVVAGTKDAITMIECGALEVPEELMLEAVNLAHREIKKICAFQEELLKAYKPMVQLITQAHITEDIEQAIGAFIATGNHIDGLFGLNKPEYQKRLRALYKETKEAFRTQIAEHGWDEAHIEHAVYDCVKNEMRLRIMRDGKRLDGRAVTQVRDITTMVGVLPRTHGSAIFQRGATQALSITTLGSPGDAQIVDEMDDDQEKRYMHHYNFPPYANGEVKQMRSTNRREIGHGYLAERALLPVVPDKSTFPYVIRVVSEITSSNGSTSMASVCGSTLSLMDAGVPLKAMVSGVAMGIIIDEATSSSKILTDIQDQEDFLGDMDFKVAGTEAGITAMQMDTKVKGIPGDIFEKILHQAKEGRLHILAEMCKALTTHRSDLSPYAPRIVEMRIQPDQIRDVIGPGGKVINDIIARTGVKIDIEDSGQVFVSGTDAAQVQKALEIIKSITYTAQVGDQMTGRVVRIMDFGAFVEIAPGKDGLVHISELAPMRVNMVEDIVSVGDMIEVEVIKIDDMGRINLTHRPFYKSKG